jgi:hypothetical protein
MSEGLKPVNKKKTKKVKMIIKKYVMSLAVLHALNIVASHTCAAAPISAITINNKS